MTTQSARQAAAYGMAITPATVRRVCAAITARPGASVREIGDELGLGYGTVSTALRMLRDAGYITYEARTARAYTVIVPFVVGC